MKITTKIRYGIKALKHIAETTKEGKLARIKEISEAQSISSIQYLEQILFKLKNENIIEGRRGPYGGYKMLVEPQNITLHDLYKILDNEEKVIDCNENFSEKTCVCSPECIWGKLDTAMVEILKKTTLEDIIKSGNY